MFSLHGTGIGGGIVIGRARVLESHALETVRYRLQPAQVDAEIGRLDAALQDVRDELSQVARQLTADAPSEARALLEVHGMLLEDPSLTEEARESIREHGWNAEWALASQAGRLAAQFEEIDDEYLRERGRDVQQVASRVLRALSGSGPRYVARVDDAIIVASDIAPSDMLTLKNALGFAIDLGGIMSHTAILARSLNVPGVVGLHCASELIRDDDWLILDGDAGVLIVAPDEGVLDQYRRRQADTLREREKLKLLIHVPSVTADGVPVELHANIELPDEAQHAYEAGAAGIGLFRSEFLFMNRRELPGEDEQFEAYTAAVRAMRGRPVTIRTLDIGADKALETDGAAVPANPALGQRAIRWCLAEPDMFLVQLRAILRASALGNVRLLVPMLAHQHEVLHTRQLIERARQQLADRRVAYDAHVPVGGMIEVPAAAITARVFAKKLDFLSIGTNDLVQYTLAIDRADHSVAALYDPYHPAVLRLIADTIRAAQRRRKPVAVCGEMAGDWAATRLLLGMGLTQFSMHPASLLRVKRELLEIEVQPLRGRVRRLLASDDPRLVHGALARLSRRREQRQPVEDGVAA